MAGISVKLKLLNVDFVMSDEAQIKNVVETSEFQDYKVIQDERLIRFQGEGEDNNHAFSLFLDKLKYTYNNEDKIITLSKVLDEKNPNSAITIMQTKTVDEKSLFKFLGLFEQQKIKGRFKDPLAFAPSKKERVSMLDSENTKQNFRGFLNLAFLVLLVTNFRLVIENFLKYGWLFSLPNPIDYSFNIRSYPILNATFGLGLFLVAALFIERSAFKGKISERASIVLNIANISLSILFPYSVVAYSKPHPGPAFILIQAGLILTLKLVSYAHVMHNVRSIYKRIKEVEAQKKHVSDFIGENELSPENYEVIKKNLSNLDSLVSLKDLMYFIFAPTLCFQLVYPRSPRIRKIWLFKRVVEYLLITSLMIFIFIQYIQPTIANALPHLNEGNIWFMLERLLKLSIPNLYLWIAMFFALFHVQLNILAEVLRFGDREFYQDWWNCRNLDEYWKLWNLPVHFWFLRHVYNPLLKKGVNKNLAMIVVFFISAVAHEYLVSASIRLWTFWAFLAMMIQAPIMIIQRYIEMIFPLKNSQLGNVMFWISFCFIGQPVCVFVYYYLYITNREK